MASIPILGSHEINLWETLMYKTPNKNKAQHWLLFDNNHYHVIMDIKAFLGVKHICHSCFKMHKSDEVFEKHKCNEVKPKQKENKATMIKDVAHYMKAAYVKGGKE
jgi:hypothetical protein